MIKRVTRRKKNKKRLLTKNQALFTWLKQNCNLIFNNYKHFQNHIREHFGIGNKIMCWQCCSAFDNLSDLRRHQRNVDCRTSSSFKCHECFEEHVDLQSLSIHKYIMHNCQEVSAKNKPVICPHCNVMWDFPQFKEHLFECLRVSPRD